MNQLYQKYRHRNFEILGVSFDKQGDKDKWANAIIKDQIKWPQVSELKGFDNTLATYYAIDSIPYCMLVDMDGKIIGSRYTEADLIIALQDIFENSSQNSSSE